MRQIAVWALAVALLPAQNTVITYDTVPESEIQRRVNDFKHTNSEREQELKVLFEEAGCKNVVEQPVKHSRNPNVICTLPGQTGQPIVVGGHFDFVDNGQGVVDNWSGCSLLPSLYLSLKSSNRRHTFVFVGFADEEKGLVGSAFYVNQMGKDELREIRAMINLDSLGASTTKVELDRGNKALINALGIVASSMHLPVNAVNVHAVGRSDSDSFEDRRVPTINVHSLTNETWPILHTRNDTMAAMHLADYYDSYRLLAAYLAYLDVSLDAPPAADK
jgi:Zn-dependent M28 family amino/carboxypeptidase